MSADEILVTGAAGFLGAHLIHALLARGERVVVLVRPAPGISATERIRRVLGWFGDDGTLAARATVVAGDLGQDRIVGLTATPGASFAGRPRSPLETLFEGYLAVFRPYMLDHRRFTTRSCRDALGAADAACPAFTFEVFSRAMAYAERTAWGKRLFETGTQVRRDTGPDA